MDLVNNCDKILIRKLADIRKTGQFYHPTERVTVECDVHGITVNASHPLSDPTRSIRVKQRPFNWFGLKRIAPFQQRVQDAVDKLQRECDEDMWRNIRQHEMNQRLNPRIPSTPPQGGSGVPPKPTTEDK